MYVGQAVIINKTGLHARPAYDFVNLAKEYNSEIKVRNLNGDDSQAVNAKSIVFLLSLGICEGDKIEIMAKGNDEEEAVTALINLVVSGFNEI